MRRLYSRIKDARKISLAEHAKSAEGGKGMTSVGVVAAPFGWLQVEIRKGVVQGLLASALFACSARGNEMFRCLWLDVSELHTRPWSLRLRQTFGAAAARPLTPTTVTIDREVPGLPIRRVKCPEATQPAAGD